MKKISNFAIAVALSMTVAATATATLAQNRPDCLTSENPGACFIDGEMTNPFNLCGALVTMAFSGDVDGSWAMWSFSGDAGDFERYNGENGQAFFHVNVTDADMWVCPATAGGVACLIEYFDTCVVPAGMLTGSGSINGTEIFGGGCHVAASGEGTVENQSGQSFKVKFLWVQRPDPQSSDQCVEVKHELSITLE